MAKVHRVTVGQNDQRLDKAIAELVPQVSRRFARELISQGLVFVDGQRCKSQSRKVMIGTHVIVHMPVTEVMNVTENSETGVVSKSSLGTKVSSEDIEIIYEDKHILVLNKPVGIHVNPTETKSSVSLVELFEQKDARVVHRLDVDTSGVLVLAKGSKQAALLSEAFAKRIVEKSYVTIVEGEGVTGTVNQPIGQDRNRPRNRVVRVDGRPSTTEFKVLTSKEDVTLLEARPITGRTHQIRVHLSYLGMPILGDIRYGGVIAVRLGGDVWKAQRPLLHSKMLTLPGWPCFEAKLPYDIGRFVDFLSTS